MSYTLTTPLYYVNDKPHLGSTYTTLACDALARFKRLTEGDVVFITGVDEHGQKIQRTAEQNNISPMAHCDQVSERYQDLWSRWNISQDRFVRTTNKLRRKDHSVVCQGLKLAFVIRRTYHHGPSYNHAVL